MSQEAGYRAGVMNTVITTQKEEGLQKQKGTVNAQHPTSSLQAERVSGEPDALPGRGEQLFLESLMDFTRTAKRSQSPTVARAAKEWEGIIGFRIQVNRQNRRTKSFRVFWRSRRGAFPKRG